MMAPPDDIETYLGRDYVDAIAGVTSRRLYVADGRVIAFNGREWWQACRFSEDQIARARAAIKTSGLMDATDLTAPASLHDTADLSYTWRLDGRTGTVTNHAYPALAHPAFDALEIVLNALEDEASDD